MPNLNIHAVTQATRKIRLSKRVISVLVARVSDPELTTRQALLILNGLRRIGPVSLNRLMEAFEGDPIAILNASRSEWTRVQGVGTETADSLEAWRDFPLEREEGNLAKRKGGFLILGDEEYPPLLREIYDPPIGLYRLGELPKKPFVAIVGTRKPTLYGTAMARKFAAGLTRAGLCVVSGMARGIDTAAHEGALEAGGDTVAVFGTGLDVIYPPENLDLFKDICANGAVLSEFPFGRRADRQTFPMRNRLVSGMSEGVIVVESGSAGGSLITARFAGEQGRQVLALPGRVDQPSSAGCHQLIRDGAVLVRSVSDIVEELAASIRFAAPAPSENESTDHFPADNAPENDFSSAERRVMDCFRDGAMLKSDDLVALTKLPVPDLATHLTALELKRAIARRPDGSFEAV